MLVLTRNINQVLIIDGNIKVKVLGVSGNQIRLGIDAPRDITVDREEIHERRQAESGQKA